MKKASNFLFFGALCSLPFSQVIAQSSSNKQKYATDNKTITVYTTAANTENQRLLLLARKHQRKPRLMFLLIQRKRFNLL
jgi:hypothetical protein